MANERSECGTSSTLGNLLEKSYPLIGRSPGRSTQSVDRLAMTFISRKAVPRFLQHDVAFSAIKSCTKGKMKLHILDTEPKIAELSADTAVINTLQDAVDILGNTSYLEVQSVIVYDYQLHPNFFNLRSGLAGDILQKFSNYQMRLAIIGDFSTTTSNALNAFIIECNRGNHVFFLPTKEAALEKLTR